MAVRGTVPVYSGACRACGRHHRFHNDDALALASLDALFSRLEMDAALADMKAALELSGGKMVGVLVTQGGVELKAFSGDLAKTSRWDGWSPSVMDRSVTAELEALTLARLAELERELAACDVDQARRQLQQVQAAVDAEAAVRREQVRVQRQQRGLERRAGVDVSSAAEAAVRENHAASAAEMARVAAARTELRQREDTRRTLRESRRTTSATLMTAMFDGMALTSVRGETRPLREVFTGGGIPSGTAECAAPKLLHDANQRGLRPVALAEAWWGPTQNGRAHGDLQAPCTKCSPILGHLLCGVDGP